MNTRIRTTHWQALLLASLSLVFMAQFSRAVAQAGDDADLKVIEQRDFDAAIKSFEDGLQDYTRAEEELTAFLRNWPKSPLKTIATLRLGQAKIYRTNLTEAIEMLTVRLPFAEKWADQYQFWIGEAWFKGSEFDKAAIAYARLAERYPESSLVFTARYNEALSRFKIYQYRQAIDLLENPEGDFQKLAAKSPRTPIVSSGYLLTAEAWLELAIPEGAQRALNNLASWNLNDAQKWLRQYLLCRLALISGDANPALTATTNLLMLATGNDQANLRSQTYQLRAAILEKLNRRDEAALVLTNNLGPAVPSPIKRQSLLKIVDLDVSSGRTDLAIARLQSFVGETLSTDPVYPLARFTLGELTLKQHYLYPTETNSAARTNLLLIAADHFSSVITNANPQEFGAKAYLQRGWCHWNLGAPDRALPDFQNALNGLPFSSDQAVALLKLGEVSLLQNDSTNAIKHLRRLLAEYETVPDVKDSLFDAALYQILRAAIKTGDLPLAEDAAAKILLWYPSSFFSDRSLLIFGEALNRNNRPEDARKAFKDLLTKFPHTSLAPKVRLAIARTFKRERNWSGAAVELESWVTDYPTNSFVPDVEYERAWLNFQAGNTSRAFHLFTNYTARFTTHANAPLAEKWVADYYYNQRLYDKAEAGYQRLFQNEAWPFPKLKFEARLAAGRAAFAREGYKDATNYFLTIINHPSPPPDLLPEAFFALGDTFFSGGLTADPFADAINAYSRVTNAFPNSRLSAFALGAIGNCHLQLATRTPQRMEMAAIAYQQAMDWPNASSMARTKAELGLAIVREKQKRPAEAVRHYANVFYEKNVKPGEPLDFVSIKEAGLAIARLSQEQQRWSEAENVYQRMRSMFPSMRKTLTARLDELKKVRETPVN